MQSNIYSANHALITVNLSIILFNTELAFHNMNMKAKIESQQQFKNAINNHITYTYYHLEYRHRGNKIKQKSGSAFGIAIQKCNLFIKPNIGTIISHRSTA